METTKKVNGMRHTIKKTFENVTVYGNRYPVITMKAEIRLDDKCKNGHNDFAITGTIWRGTQCTDGATIVSGACGDKLALLMPELDIFERLHLSDVMGVPMHAMANGFYFLKNGGNNNKSPKDTTMEQMRITESEFLKVSIAEDEKHFQYLMEEMEIPKRWKLEAEKAISILEEWTGNIFEDNSARLHYKPLTAKERSDFKSKLDSGYYSPEQLADRAAKKYSEKIFKLIQDLTDRRDKEILKANIEFNIQMEVLRCGLPLDNFIYYNHTNEGVFNWHTSPYNPEVTAEQFAAFIKIVDYSTLPKGIKFKNKK